MKKETGSDKQRPPQFSAPQRPEPAELIRWPMSLAEAMAYKNRCPGAKVRMVNGRIYRG